MTNQEYISQLERKNKDLYRSRQIAYAHIYDITCGRANPADIDLKAEIVAIRHDLAENIKQRQTLKAKLRRKDNGERN